MQGIRMKKKKKKKKEGEEILRCWRRRKELKCARNKNEKEKEKEKRRWRDIKMLTEKKRIKMCKE